MPALAAALDEFFTHARAAAPRRPARRRDEPHRRAQRSRSPASTTSASSRTRSASAPTTPSRSRSTRRSSTTTSSARPSTTSGAVNRQDPARRRVPRADRPLRRGVPRGRDRAGRRSTSRRSRCCAPSAPALDGRRHADAAVVAVNARARAHDARGLRRHASASSRASSSGAAPSSPPRSRASSPSRSPRRTSCSRALSLEPADTSNDEADARSERGARGGAARAAGARARARRLAPVLPGSAGIAGDLRDPARRRNEPHSRPRRGARAADAGARPARRSARSRATVDDSVEAATTSPRSPSRSDWGWRTDARRQPSSGAGPARQRRPLGLLTTKSVLVGGAALLAAVRLSSASCSCRATATRLGPAATRSAKLEQEGRSSGVAQAQAAPPQQGSDQARVAGLHLGRVRRGWPGTTCSTTSRACSLPGRGSRASTCRSTTTRAGRGRDDDCATTLATAPTAFTVSGLAFSQDEVAQVMDRLERVPALSDVTLQSSARRTAGHEGLPVHDERERAPAEVPHDDASALNAQDPRRARRAVLAARRARRLVRRRLAAAVEGRPASTRRSPTSRRSSRVAQLARAVAEGRQGETSGRPARARRCRRRADAERPPAGAAPRAARRAYGSTRSRLRRRRRQRGTTPCRSTVSVVRAGTCRCRSSSAACASRRARRTAASMRRPAVRRADRRRSTPGGDAATELTASIRLRSFVYTGRGAAGHRHDHHLRHRGASLMSAIARASPAAPPGPRSGGRTDPPRLLSASSSCSCSCGRCRSSSAAPGHRRPRRPRPSRPRSHRRLLRRPPPLRRSPRQRRPGRRPRRAGSSICPRGIRSFR